MVETKTKKYEVRKLNTKDLFAMTKIVSKISGDLRQGIRDLQMRKIDEQLFGIMIFEAMLKHAESDMKGLLADIAGMTVEEFETEPFDAPLIILEEVMKQDDLKGFFSRVQSLTTNLSSK